MAKSKIIKLPNASIPEGTINPDIVLLLKSLLIKAQRGEIIGFCSAWVEGQNDICYQIEGGHARDALLVAGVTGLFLATNERWRKNGQKN